jgi:hypothetical protein
MPISIFHVGLPLDHPLIPPEDRERIAKRLRDLVARMTDAGYRYEIVHCSPETGLDDYRRLLQTQPCDGILIGGGVAADSGMSYFMEQIIDATHELAPRAKIMFFNHSVDPRITVERWFPPQLK